MLSELTAQSQRTSTPGAAGLRRGPVVLELVGAAAAGKSTLLRSLQQQDTTIRAGLQLSPIQHLTSAIHLLPTFRALHQPYRGLRWKETKRIVFLKTLERALEARPPAVDGAVALDEGAIYMLARLRVLGGDWVQAPAFQAWWQRAIERWSDLLDFVVCLDADDPTLMYRLRSRPQSHPAQDFSDEAIKDFMEMYRRIYGSIVSAVAAAGRTQVMRFRTDRQTATSIAAEIVSEVRLRCR